MSSSLSTIEQESTLLEAFRKAEDRNSRALLVKASGQVCGVVTSRDIGRELVVDEEMASRKQVGDVMSRRVAACYEDSDVSKVRTFARERQIHHLLVCNRDKKIVGFLSAADLE